jgi:hypothetical protein
MLTIFLTKLLILFIHNINLACLKQAPNFFRILNSMKLVFIRRKVAVLVVEFKMPVKGLLFLTQNKKDGFQ